MTFTPLASSSKGNAYLLDDGKTRILIECGLTFKKLRQALGFGVAGLDGCIVTHEHKDHAKCYGDLVKSGIPVYASQGTSDALEFENFEIFEEKNPFTIGTFEIFSFKVYHDAKEPVGFLIRSFHDFDKIMFATDTANLGYQFPKAGLVAVECNYDKAILARSERVPDKVKKRIENSHMEVSATCGFLEKLDKSCLRHVYLLHLSDACSNEGSFLERVQKVCGDIPVTICPK